MMRGVVLDGDFCERLPSRRHSFAEATINSFDLVCCRQTSKNLLVGNGCRPVQIKNTFRPFAHENFQVVGRAHCKRPHRTKMLGFQLCADSARQACHLWHPRPPRSYSTRCTAKVLECRTTHDLIGQGFRHVPKQHLQHSRRRCSNGAQVVATLKHSTESATCQGEQLLRHVCVATRRYAHLSVWISFRRIETCGDDNELWVESSGNGHH
mmetsp:Transcript_34003/g.93824  ORF Transcript_34003/g.93824 Transcript_34003/m.93824 type:complete len:210 (-) Transcript_34003:169-798(-)